MKVLVIGSGAREHALVRARPSTRPSTPSSRLPATRASGGGECRPIDPEDGGAVADLAVEVGADLVVVGPEAPLVAGRGRRACASAGIACFGPDGRGRALEGSKAFAKEVMAAAERPHRDGARVHHPRRGRGRARRVRRPARRQGRRPGRRQGRRRHRRPRRRAGPRARPASTRQGAVVVEEFLDGPEVSLFCLTDGARRRRRSPRRRTSSGSATATPGRTPVAWAPTPRCRGRPTRWSTTWWTRVAQPDDRRDGPARHAVHRRCSTAASPSPPAGCGSSSSTPASATPRPRWCSPGCGTPLGELLYAAATGRLAERAPPLRWRDDAARHRGRRGRRVPRRGALRRRRSAASRRPSRRRACTCCTPGPRSTATGRLVTGGGRVLSVVGIGADLDAARAAAYQGRRDRDRRRAAPHRHRRRSHRLNPPGTG